MTDYTHSFGTSPDFGLGSDNFGDYGFDDTAGFNAVNNGTGTTSTSTVSPKDLFNDYSGSAPASTAFTNLTSPDVHASPYIGSSSTEVSPMFYNTEDIGADTSDWFSLFPESGKDQVMRAPPMQRNDSEITDSSPGDSPLVMLDEHNFRRKPSNNSPGHGRHSSISGVKPRRRKTQLQPIAVDSGDKVAVKRARNTLAARESRQRKLDHLGILEARIKELEDNEVALKNVLSGYGYNGPLMQG